jgi:uncharacterized membrane protein (Fun14 family)
LSIENFGPTAATLGGSFFVGVLIGYALKKVIKLVAVIFGLFLAVLAYLQYHQIANINWNKLQQMSEGAITTLSNLTMQIPGISSGNDGDIHTAATASSLAMTSFGIPLTGSMSAGLIIEESSPTSEQILILFLYSLLQSNVFQKQYYTVNGALYRRRI